MGKQYRTDYVSWRDAANRPFGLFPNEQAYCRAAAEALESKINALADDGWIVDRVLPAQGFGVGQRAAFTVVSFK